MKLDVQVMTIHQQENSVKESELKNCPFCAGTPEMEISGTQADIMCLDCYASNNIQISDYFTKEERFDNPAFKWRDAPYYDYGTAGTQRAKETLIKLWNTRADPNKDKLVEALKLLLEAKKLKETSGKDAAYQELKKRAWEAAEAAIAKEG